MQSMYTPAKSVSKGLRPMAWKAFSLTLYKMIPSPAYRVRREVLVLFGAKLDRTSRVRGGVTISEPWNLTMGRKSSIGEGAIIWAHDKIVIGARSVVSQYCFVSSARWRGNDPYQPEVLAALSIGDDVWIAAESVILGGQHIPNGVLVGTRSTLLEPIEPWTIATGHPAKSRRDREYNGPKL